MKTYTKYSKTDITVLVCFLLIVVISLISTNKTLAQQEPSRELDRVKGIQETYSRFDGGYGTFTYINSKYTNEDIRALYPPIGPGSDIEGTFSIKTESNEIIMKTVWSIFSTEKIQKMADNDEKIIMIWQINQLGEPLSTGFNISGTSIITIDELELLERELFANLTFIPYDVDVKNNASTFVIMQFTFKEVLDKTVDIYKPWGIGKRLIDKE